MSDLVNKAGVLAYVGSQHTEYTYMWSEEPTGIPFGAGVMRGTNKETQCKLMTTGGQFLGIAKAYQRNVYDKEQYDNQTTVEIITKGKVWVKVEEPVVAGDKAACGDSGKFKKTSGSGYDEINGVFETSADSGKYVILNLK